jgi:hypothetical protein
MLVYRQHERPGSLEDRLGKCGEILDEDQSPPCRRAMADKLDAAHAVDRKTELVLVNAPPTRRPTIMCEMAHDLR